ncbi:Rhodanese-like domain-containing protein [Desulfonatronum thiosulfatophilum]|uniref:Rhodanese-like domain-containing protein n=2 Tax=Desulfonatronum thiosulfatophilum TaxID=617002 RepID=A0A1G6AMR6_9BACT|nr:Rhodanese-like domain-containing protein [Desulfonatronum thiosulfatophilum]
MHMNRNHSANRSKALAFFLFVFVSSWPALAAPQDNTAKAAEEASPLFIQAQRSAEQDGYTLITTPELRRLMDENPNVLLVDVRFAYEFVSGHMPGAISLPVDLRDRGDLPRERREAMLDVFGPDKERPIVVYCRDFR